MKPLKTDKSLDIDENGDLTVNECEWEASRRMDARLNERADKLPTIPHQGSDEDWQNYREQLDALNEQSPRPVIEPLRTWHIGRFEGDVLEIAVLATSWLGKRTLPLQEQEIEELREYLSLHLKGEGLV